MAGVFRIRLLKKQMDLGMVSYSDHTGKFHGDDTKESIEQWISSMFRGLPVVDGHGACGAGSAWSFDQQPDILQASSVAAAAVTFINNKVCTCSILWLESLYSHAAAASRSSEAAVNILQQTTSPVDLARRTQ